MYVHMCVRMCMLAHTRTYTHAHLPGLMGWAEGLLPTVPSAHEAHAVHAYGPPTPLDAGSVHFSAVKNAVIHIVLKSTPKKSS